MALYTLQLYNEMRFDQAIGGKFVVIRQNYKIMQNSEGLAGFGVIVTIAISWKD